jgi:mannose-1-phosphate guanylyltransferase
MGSGDVADTATFVYGGPMRYALILAGGSGTRLWPLSRDARPKQLVPVLEGRSLLEEAWHRLSGLVPEERRYVCGAERHRAASTLLLPVLAAGERGGLYIGEPEGRDTLAALALSSALIARRDPEAIVAVFTSDHVIRPREDFRTIVDRAYRLVEADPRRLVTFGVEPDRPATGFGYLELGDSLPGEDPGAPARRVLRFREKPDAAAAATFVAAGKERYLWNSGMFVWKAARFLELVGRYEPSLRADIDRIAEADGTPGYAARLAEIYPRLRKTSVDYGVMEPASVDRDVAIAAVPLSIEWKDIGSWSAYGDLYNCDESRNASSGRSAFVESAGNLSVSTEEGHLVAFLGCEDLVVVHTPDATLVCPRSRADELKKLHAVVSALEGGRYK